VSALAEAPVRTIDAGDVRIGYREVGAGPPLLLVMGLGADGSLWEEHVAALAARFRCIAVDNRGAGASSKPPGPYTTATMADDHAAAMRALGIEGFGVVGISMGGAIAQELALRHPELIERIVLVSSWARCDRYLQELLANLAAVRAAASIETFAQLLQLWIWAPESFAARADELAEARGLDPSLMVRVKPFAAQAAACASHDALERLGSIGVPALVTVGDLDVFTPPRFSEELAERIPDAQLRRFPGAGHVHHWEALDAFNDLLLEWL
jgi:pimeloyl-ACP methyl ester carboxylesterase